MAAISPELVWQLDKVELSRLIDSKALIHTPRRVGFYVPSFASYRTPHFRSSPNQFPTFSVTGNVCALNCGHCGGRVLGSMTATNTPSRLFQAAQKLKEKGGLGCLISGGCLPDGSVPLRDFVPTLARIKKELSLVVIVHTGVVDLNTAEMLKKADVDSALIDIIGSNRAIKQTCHLDVTTEDYERSLKALSTAGLNFIPHVIVGLENGKLNGEFHALKMISRFSPSAIVIIAFMPIPGTGMANVGPPQPLDIARVVATARLMFAGIPLALGCMRPKGKNRDETDVLALKAGVDAIAFPSQKVVEFAGKNGYDASFSPCCCSQIYVKLPSAFHGFSK